MSLRAGLAAVLWALAPVATAEPGKADPAITHWEADGVRRIWTYLKDGDCAGAVKEVNAGLSRKYAVVMVMAGAMYEDGLCLKRNPERAIALFEQAYAAGRTMQASGRLAALYAAAGPAQDKAAALWWAQRGAGTVAALCTGATLPLEDADAFVKALAALPPGRLDACNYVAGVLGMIQGDVEFPSRAATFGMTGSVQLVFLPAEARFEVKGTDLGTVQLGGLVHGDAVRDDRPLVRNEFVNHLTEMTRGALQRFAKPAAVPPDWRFTTEYRFGYSP